jgi:hypothetical protein
MGNQDKSPAGGQLKLSETLAAGKRRLDGARRVAGLAINEAEDSLKSLETSVKKFDQEELRTKVGLVIAVGSSEVFRLNGGLPPSSHKPADFDQSIGSSGRFDDLVVFDRKSIDLRQDQSAQLEIDPESRYEVCLTIEPLRESQHPYAVKTTTLVPIRLLEGLVHEYQGPA